MTIRNDNCLIGDFIGTIPAMQYMQANCGADFIINRNMQELGDMAMIPYEFEGSADKTFNLMRAFGYAAQYNLHMIQANFNEMSLPVPKSVPRPHLLIREMKVPKVDYVLSPFSNSLPTNERWPKEKWIELVKGSNKTFALIGGVNDEPFINELNCINIFGESLCYIANLLLNCKALISVVTGTSHLAYALDVKNILFCVQGSWGKNPQAIILNENIPGIHPNKVINMLW